MKRSLSQMCAVVAFIVFGICGSSGGDAIHGLVIDDFEEGPFWTDQLITISGLSGQSCLGGERQIITSEYDGPVHLEISSADDGVIIESGDLGGIHTLNYTLPTVDLTDGGSFDRLVLRFSSVPNAVSVNVSVFINGTSLGPSQPVPPTPGELSFFLSEYPFSPQNVDHVGVGFDSQSGPSSLQLADIRLKGSYSNLKFVDLTRTTYTGDFPLPEVLIATLVKDEPGGFLPRDPIFMTVEQVSHEGTPVSVSLLVEDSVPGADPGAAFGFTLADEAVAGKRADHRDGVLTFDNPATQPGEINALVGDPTVEYSPGSKVGYVEYLVETSDGAGVADRRSSYRLRLEIPEARSLVFEQIIVDVVSATAFQLGFSEVPSAAKSPLESDIILRGELTGSEAPVVYSTTTPPGAAGLSPRIGARPSVWSRSTQFWAQGTHGDGVIRVYDAMGREIRKLDLPAKLQYVDWDGRDSAGRPVGSGVYYARYAGYEGSATTKLLRLK